MSNFTPTTKRCLVAGIIIMGAGVTAGWAFGNIKADDAMLIILPIVTGCFSLLKEV